MRVQEPEKAPDASGAQDRLLPVGETLRVGRRSRMGALPAAASTRSAYRLLYSQDIMCNA
jgi:hypothetical protein